MAQYRSALLQLRIPGIPVGSRQGLSPAPFPLIGVLAVPLLCPDDSLESGPGETVHADLVDDALQGSRQVLPHRCYPIYLICTAFTPPTLLLSGANNCVSMRSGEAEDVAHYDPPGDFAGIDLWKGCRFHVGRGGGTTVDTHWLHLRQPTRHAH
jgi:hypothetical protein